MSRKCRPVVEMARELWLRMEEEGKGRLVSPEFVKAILPHVKAVDFDRAYLREAQSIRNLVRDWRKTCKLPGEECQPFFVRQHVDGYDKPQWVCIRGTEDAIRRHVDDMWELRMDIAGLDRQVVDVRLDMVAKATLLRRVYGDDALDLFPHVHKESDGSLVTSIDQTTDEDRHDVDREDDDDDDGGSPVPV